MSKSGWNYNKAIRDSAGNLFDTLRGHTRSFQVLVPRIQDIKQWCRIPCPCQLIPSCWFQTVDSKLRFPIVVLISGETPNASIIVGMCCAVLFCFCFTAWFFCRICVACGEISNRRHRFYSGSIPIVGFHHGGLCEKRGDNCCATSKALRQEPDQLDVGFLLCSLCGSWQFYFKLYAQSVRTSVSSIKLGGQ